VKGKDMCHSPVWSALLEESQVILDVDEKKHLEKHGEKNHFRYEPDYRQLLGNTKYFARILATLNYQVHNGGFRQWIDNGCGVEIDDLIGLLKEGFKEYYESITCFKGETKTNWFSQTLAGKLLELLEDQLEPIIVDDGQPDYPSIQDSRAEDFWKDCMERGFYEEISKLDDRYYAINQPNCEWEKEIEGFLNWMISKEPKPVVISEEEVEAKRQLEALCYDQ
jgi:hypothetical protein